MPVLVLQLCVMLLGKLLPLSLHTGNRMLSESQVPTQAASPPVAAASGACALSQTLCLCLRLALTHLKAVQCLHCQSCTLVSLANLWLGMLQRWPEKYLDTAIRHAATFRLAKQTMHIRG